MIYRKGRERKISDRHKKAILYAIDVIKKSPVSGYVKGLYLYGSCARGEARWESDVDLFMELDERVNESEDLLDEVRRLRGKVSSSGLYEPETDLKTVIGDEWKSNSMLYYQNVRREGVDIWH